MASFDHTIPPGGRGKITLSINTSGYKGRIIKSAMVETDDPARSKLRIRLEATVTPVFSLSDDEGLKIWTTVGHPSSKTVELTSNLTEPVEITDITDSFKEKADVKMEVVEPGHKYKVTLTSKAQEKVRWAGRVSLHLKNAPVPVFNIRGFVKVKDPG